MIANNMFHVSVKAALTGTGIAATTTGTPVTSTTPVRTSVTTSTTAGAGSCTGAAPWQSDVIVSQGVRNMCFR